nr:hypothetical protein [Tanacetum cinerariifolium]
MNPIRCLSSILLARFVPRRAKAKVHKERRLLMTLKKLLMYLKSLNLNMNQLKERLLVKRKVKKKVTLSTNDNIISDDPDTTLELGKSISQTKAEEAEAAKQVHATHARIVTESVTKPTKRRKSSIVTSDPPKKLKGAPSLTPEEQEAADIMQALKESKKTSKRQSGTRGSSEGTGTIPRVPNESTVISATLSEGTGTKPGVLNEEKEITKENVILEWGSVKENDETKSDEDDIYKYKIRVRKDEDEEMINAKVDDFVKVLLRILQMQMLVLCRIFPSNKKLPRPSLHQYRRTRIREDCFRDSTNQEGTSEKQQTLKFTIKSTDKAALKEYDLKSTLYSKAPSKGSKTGKSASTKEPVKEPIVELVMHDAGDYVAHDDEASSKPKTANTLNRE